MKSRAFDVFKIPCFFLPMSVVWAGTLRADALEDPARPPANAVSRSEPAPENARAAWEAERQARRAAESKLAEARTRIRRLETELERRAALLQAGTESLRREIAGREEERDQAPPIAVSRGGSDSDPSDLGSAPGEPVPPAPRARTSLHAPIPVARSRTVPRSASGPPRASETAPSWDRVRAEWESGNLETAAILATDLSQSGRPSAEQWALLGQIEFQRGRLEPALRAYERAVRRAPRDAALLKEMALIAHAAGDVDGAIRHFSRVVALNEQDGEAHFNLAALHLMLPRPNLQESAKHYQRALRLGEPRDENLEQILFR